MLNTPFRRFKLAQAFHGASAIRPQAAHVGFAPFVWPTLGMPAIMGTALPMLALAVTMLRRSF